MDDVIGIGLPSKAKKVFHDLCDLLEELGFSLSDKKLVFASTLATCLGVEIDTVELTISVSPSKHHDICKRWG